jgi:hypothetical protein
MSLFTAARVGLLAGVVLTAGVGLAESRVGESLPPLAQTGLAGASPVIAPAAHNSQSGVSLAPAWNLMPGTGWLGMSFSGKDAARGLPLLPGASVFARELTVAVPEPASIILMGTVLLAFVALVRRRPV